MKRFIPLFIFSIAFGLLESIVVVYLRQIYYPDGFAFPLRILQPEMIKIEIVREISTIIMLLSIGYLSGKTFIERFSYFIFSFGVWDIFYYAGLKLFLNWPESLLTWDVLFLIPITWIGPVLAPLICSIGMIFIALITIFLIERSHKLKFTALNLIMIIAGVFIIVLTFIFDYARIIIQNDFIKDFFTLTENKEFWNTITSYVPQKFNWYLFLAGCLIIGGTYFKVFMKSFNHNKKRKSTT